MFILKLMFTNIFQFFFRDLLEIIFHLLVFPIQNIIGNIQDINGYIKNLNGNVQDINGYIQDINGCIKNVNGYI